MNVPTLTKILVIDVAGIGDLMLAVPAIRALRKGYPSSYIAVLTSPRCVDILKGCPYINDIFTLKSLIYLRKMRFDIAVNLYQLFSFLGAIKIMWLLRFIKPKITAGRNTDGKGNFFMFKVADSLNNLTYRHEVEITLDLVTLIGAKLDGTHLELWLDKYEQGKADALLEVYGIQQNILVGLNPGSYQSPKRWDVKHFAKVGKYIIDRYNAAILIFGDCKDKLIADRLSSNINNRCIVLAGKLNLKYTAAIISRCRLFITNDTGLMHIAVALGVPVIAIFGPSNPDRFGPYDRTDGKYIVIRKGDDINAVKAEDVIEAVESRMQKYVNKD